MGVEIYIDTSRFAAIFANEMAFEVARQIEAFAQRRVAVDSGDLKGSITIVGIAPAEYIVFAQAPYALAQEYGLRAYGKPNYRYQPYMRPAAVQASTSNNISIAKEIALNRAIQGSKI